LDRKQKLLIFLLTFSLFVGGIYFLCYLNRIKNFNLLLITIDSLRPDHLGCYGYEKNTSPNIDKLAKEGVLFTQAIAQASWTWPSLYSLITSTYPSTHGVYFWDQVLSDSIPTLLEILKKKGYSTGFISGHGGLDNFKRGFDKFENMYEKANKITYEALLWIKSHRNKRFFLWIHYMDTHNNSIGVPEEKHFIKNITKEELNTYISQYDEAISYVDSQIGILLEKLSSLGLHEKNLIIITADHGQEMCEHGICFNHGGFLWDSAIKVPLIFYFPKLFSKNRIISQQAQHIDIAPTICDILKLKKPKTFEGKSLLPLIKGKDIQSRFAFSEHKENKGDLSSGKWVYSKFSIRTSKFKLIYTFNSDSRGYELYNLKEDPQELNNLIDKEKEQFEFLKKKLEEWMNRPKPKIAPLTKPIDEKTKEKLKSLGYLQ